MSSRRSHKKHRSDRKKHSSNVQSELISIISDSGEGSEKLKNNAVKNLIALNQKHRLKMPKNVGLMICKQCKVIQNAVNTRVRIKDGQLIVSCLDCNNIRRLGGGPKFNRRNPCG